MGTFRVVTRDIERVGRVERKVAGGFSTQEEAEEFIRTEARPGSSRGVSFNVQEEKSPDEGFVHKVVGPVPRDRPERTTRLAQQAREKFESGDKLSRGERDALQRRTSQNIPSTEQINKSNREERADSTSREITVSKSSFRNRVSVGDNLTEGRLDLTRSGRVVRFSPDINRQGSRSGTVSKVQEDLTPAESLVRSAQKSEQQATTQTGVQRQVSSAKSFSLSAASVPVALATDPIGTLKSTVSTFRDVITKTKQTGTQFGQSLKQNPVTTSGLIFGSIATGKGIGRGLRTARVSVARVSPVSVDLIGKVTTISKIERLDDAQLLNIKGGFKARTGGQDFTGFGSGQATLTSSKLFASATEFKVSQKGFKQPTLTRIATKSTSSEGRGGITTGTAISETAIIEPRGDGFVKETKSVRSITPFKTGEIVGGDFPRTVTKLGILSGDSLVNIRPKFGGVTVTRKVATVDRPGTGTVSFFDVFEKDVSAPVVSKLFPRKKLGKKGQLTPSFNIDPIKTFSGSTEGLLGSEFLKGIRSSVRASRVSNIKLKPRLALPTSLNFGQSIYPKTNISSITGSLQGISSKSNNKNILSTQSIVSSLTSQKTTTIPFLNTITSTDVISRTPTRPTTTKPPSITPNPFVPDIPATTPFISGSPLTFRGRTKRTTKKSKKGKRKFRGTPSVSVVLGGSGQQLTRGQITGKDFISPFAIRQL